MLIEALAAVITPTRYGVLASPTPGGRLLLRDPLTGLVAYPSFEQHLLAELPALAPVGVHLAIGDVDDLRRYVTERRATDPHMFGHLAGNDCMRRVGAATTAWEARALTGWPFAVCATFGGDEVIVAASGLPFASFATSIRELADDIGRVAPRSCSFAVATTAPSMAHLREARSAYQILVARVDAALFDRKDALRSSGIDPSGDVIVLDPVALPPELESAGTLAATPRSQP